MPWVLLFLGGLFSLGIHNSFSSVFFGATFGLLLGLSIKNHQLSKGQKKLQEELQTLKKEAQHFQRSTSNQLIAINKQLYRFTYKENEITTPLPEKEQLAPTQPIKEVNNPATEKTPTPALETLITKTPITAHEQEAITDESQTSMAPLPAAVMQPPLEQIKEPAKDNQSISETQIPKKIVDKVNNTIESKPTHLNRNTVRVEIDDKEDFLSKLIGLARNWLLGGNTILKVGAIILFLGLAFLLRYATEGMTFPIEGRYIGVAIGGFVLIGLGWRLRNTQNNYGLVLQGTGVAVLYLTSYAAMSLHPILSAHAVFVFLLVITVFAAILAIFQDALSLAIAAALGGFAAPILASSGGGNHVALFSYFLVLNIGILSIAWFKAWRPLNLIGFIGTFGVGFAWGMKSYTPDLFWSTEPFLIIFFALYIAIGLLFARRKLCDLKHAPDERNALLHWSIRQTDYLDASILFGTPIIGFGLQYTLISHITYGAAISALILGLFYLIQAFLFYKFGSKRITLLTETNLALGVIFTSLSIPLAFNADWTSAAWALEGAGVYWVSLRQQRKIGRLFAVLLQLAASISFLNLLKQGTHSLIEGSSFGTVILIIALLFSFYQTMKRQDELMPSEKILLPLFAILGVSFIYLLAPLHFMQQGTAIGWVIAGIITLMVGRKINFSIFFTCGLVIQLLAAIVFIGNIPIQQLGTLFNANSYQFMISLLFGLLLLGNSGFIIYNQNDEYSSPALFKLKTLSLLGLIIIHFAPLFVLPWLWTACLWAIMGCLITFAALRLNLLSSLYFGLALPLAAMMVFLIKNTVLYTSPDIVFNINFILLFIISISTLLIAWRMQRAQMLGITEQNAQLISRMFLIWGISCWTIAFLIEINRFILSENRSMATLLTVAISLFIAGIIARSHQWKDLAIIQVVLTPLSFICLNQNFFSPFSHFGWLAWGAVFTVHFFNLKQLDHLIPRYILSFCHITGLWLIITVLSCGLLQLSQRMGAIESTWYWLIWMFIPSLWLLFISCKNTFSWPIHCFNKEYAYTASLPIAILMLMWFWLANTFMTGKVVNIPYIPILNPLELGLLLSLAGSICWLRKYHDQLSIHTPPYFINAILGVSLFAMSTAIVFRAAFHWINVPFRFEDQIHSMIVQASLSILWTSVALALMIRGYRKTQRELWLIGAALISLVVIKLFFIELGNSGSLARIISFTIVGFLLLVVGYFAPLPPKQKELK